LGVANLYHSANELFQSSYEHHSQLKILQPSLQEKSIPLPAIVPKMEHAKKNPMMSSWANEHVRNLVSTFGEAFNKRTSIVLLLFTSCCSFGALSKSGHKKTQKSP